MKVIPCRRNEDLKVKIDAFAETLKTKAHTLGNHGLTEREFYESGVFRGAIERIRGQFSATMRQKREFVQFVLNYMQDRNFIRDWNSAGEKNRHDYSVDLNSGRVGIIELKGCLDGNNTNIFVRPPHANEFLIWSVCTNQGADPEHNVWSGIHTRLSAEIIDRAQQVDGLIVWDFICGTTGRPCPKLEYTDDRRTAVGPYLVPPPCIYTFPATIPSPRNNPNPPPRNIEDVELLKAFHECFGGREEEVCSVNIEAAYAGTDIVRKTTVSRNGREQRVSKPTAIKRA